MKKNFYIKLPIGFSKDIHGYQTFFLELEQPNLYSLLRKLSLIYNPRIYELIDSGERDYFLFFVNGQLVKNMEQKINDNDYIMIISPVTGG